MKLNDFVDHLKQDAEFSEANDRLRLSFTVANAILRARLSQRLSQAELAELVGTKQANISRIETGQANPTLSLLQKIFQVLQLEATVTEAAFTESPHVDATPSTVISKNSIEVTNWPTSDCITEYSTTVNAIQRASTLGGVS